MVDGRLCVAVGKSRSGKSAWVRKQIAKARRVIVWDVKGEHHLTHDRKKRLPGWTVATSKAGLLAAVKAAGSGPLKISYQPRNLGEFEYWCQVAYWWATKCARCVIVAEELADVTTPAKAPAGWGMICRRVLYTGTDVYAITQRPAESDKTAIGNASYIHCHMMLRKKDREYMAAEMDISVKDISALKPLDWIERHDSGEVKTGRLRF